MRQSSVYCQIENKFHGLESMEMIHKKTFHRNQHMTQGERWHPKSTVVPVDMLDIAGDRAKELLFDQLPYELLKEKPEVCVFEVVVPWHAIQPVVACHVDFGRTSALNYFIDTNGEAFIFADQMVGFTPKDGDCYILDVTKPHFVGLSPGTVLRVLSFSFAKLPYEELRRMCAFDLCERD